jgi:cobalt-zinc-cadmium efflux system membrane fusion protein
MLRRFIPSRKSVRRVLALGLLLACGLATWLNWPWISSRWESLSKAASPQPAAANDPGPRVELADDPPDTLRIPQELFATTRFATAPVQPAPPPEQLRLPGSIVLDPNRHVRVNTLFSGSVVKMGLKGDLSQTSERLSSVPDNGLRPFDTVKKGQILCVIWSKDVGAMKTDLVNQMSKLRADRAVLERYKSVPKGVVTENQLTLAQQQVEADEVAVRNAVRNLRSAQFTEDEIAVVRREGERIKEPDSPADLEVDRTWAEIPIRAPFDGVLVESNVTIGQVVDPTLVLFKLANLDRLQVLANVYEEDLPRLQEIAREAERAEAEAATPGAADSLGLASFARAAGDKVRAWTVGYPAAGAAEPGSFEKIVPVIDPSMHTGTVTGWVDNSQRRLAVGATVIATVPLQPDPSLVAVPAAAVIEGADGPMVFVRVTSDESLFTRRKVAIASRGRELIFLRRDPTPDEAKRGAAPIRPGDVILTRGAVELNGELEALRSDAKK